jgi:hypothetical protein
VFVLLVLAWAPLHTSISQGQNTILTMALLLAGVLLVHGRRSCAGGAVLAVAATIRPSLVIGLALWYLFSIRRCWRVAVAGVLVVVLVSAIGIGRLEGADVDWWGSLDRNLEAFRGHELGPHGEGIGCLSPDRPDRFIMIDLCPVLSTWFGDGLVTQVGPGLLVTVLLAIAWLFRRRRMGPGPAYRLEPIDLALISVLTLLPVYNRSYSAIVLLIPLAWGLSAWHEPCCRWVARAVVTLLLLFLAPTASMLLGLLPPEMLTTWWANSLLLPHTTYCLLLLVVFLLVASWRITDCAAPATR